MEISQGQVAIAGFMTHWDKLKNALRDNQAGEAKAQLAEIQKKLGITQTEACARVTRAQWAD